MSGCSSDGPDPDAGDGMDKEPVRRTVLVYIVSANTLYGYDTKDLNEMLRGSAAGRLPSDARWLVYHAPYNKAPRLIEFCDGDTATLRHYEPGGSVTVERMRRVLDDVAELAPAHSYGIVLWSHGSGWIVNGVKEDLPLDPYAPSTLSFGDDRTTSLSGERMNIASLRAAIKGRDIDYIYFDCCHMGGIEVAYELRDAVRWLVFGPAETPLDGMPYDKNMAYLADGSPDALVNAAMTTFDIYADTFDSTMTMVDTDGLDRLAAATAAIYDLTPLPHPAERVTNYYGSARHGNFLDFGEYVNALAESCGVDASEFNAALAQTVIYKEAPDYFFSAAYNRSFPVYTASGLSTYVFENESGFTSNGYNTLQWARDVVSRHLH